MENFSFAFYRIWGGGVSAEDLNMDFIFYGFGCLKGFLLVLMLMWFFKIVYIISYLCRSSTTTLYSLCQTLQKL